MLLSNFNLLATAPGGVTRLRELILTLAVQGKLVPQDPGDEPASVLLRKIRTEKDRLILGGKIRQDKPLAKIAKEEKPFEVPTGWTWVHALDVCALITDGDHQAPPKATSGISFLVIGDVRDGSIDLENASRFVPLSYFEALHWSKQPCIGDVLYTTVGSFGIPVPVIEQQNFCFQRHIALFRPAITKLQGFLALVLRSSLAFQQAEKGATGIAQKTVPLSVLRELTLPLPPLAEQFRIVTRVEELMCVCDALEVKGKLEAAEHARLVSTLLGTLTGSGTPEALAQNWQRIAVHFDLLLDRPQAIDAFEKTILQLAVRGLLVPQDPKDEPASVLLQKISAEKDRLILEGKIKRDKPLQPVADEEKPFEVPQGWGWVRIDEIAEVQGGIQKTQLRRPIKEHYPYLRVANVQRDALRLGEIERFELTKEELAKWRLSAGDLLIVEGNGSADEIGRCAVWTGEINPCVYQNHLIRLRCVQSAFIAFTKLFLNAPSGTDEMKRLAITTSGLYNLSVGKIRNFVVPVPPLTEQFRIVARVEELRRLCADLRQRVSASQTTQAHLAEALVESVAA
uniref:restriction endonuclease subunit S n=1 Tax=Polaromonas sp. TaxID=1869339 RepID=UPI0015991890|nr:restriction endonuclease subunit S [Polaromonas sp.]QJS06433.1 type I restriction enzyme EcoAI specificity protein [Polaromonas sp.]